MNRLDKLIQEEFEKFQADSEKVLEGSQKLNEKTKVKSQYEDLVKLGKAKLANMLKSKYKITNFLKNISRY